MKKLWMFILVGLISSILFGITANADTLSNDGEAIDNPYGDSGLPSSFDTGDYYDCAIPYALSIDEVGGYADGVIRDPHNYGVMPESYRNNIPGFWFNWEGDCINSGHFNGLVSKVLGNNGSSSYESDTGATLITINDVNFYVTAVQPFFYNNSVADDNNFAGCSELGQTNVDPVGHLIDVILTDGTCIHYICGDINSINHTNGGPAESPFREVQWTFTDLKYSQYKNLYAAAGGNTLEVWGKSGCSTKLADKYNLGSGEDNNHIAYYRMYNLSVNDSFHAASDEAKNVSYNVGDIDASSNRSKNANVTSDGTMILNEWELPGMPETSRLKLDLSDLSMPNRNSLSIEETNNLVSINSSLEIQRQFDIWQKVRIGFAFTGLLFVSYAIILTLCMLFDTWNNFFDISLVSMMTLGAVKYNIAAEDSLINKSTYIGTRRLVLGIVVVFSVGCLLLSGAVIPQVLRVLYAIVNGVV